MRTLTPRMPGSPQRAGWVGRIHLLNLVVDGLASYNQLASMQVASRNLQKRGGEQTPCQAH